MNIIECKSAKEWLMQRAIHIEKYGREYVKILAFPNSEYKCQFMHCEDIYQVSMNKYKCFVENFIFKFGKSLHLFPIPEIELFYNQRFSISAAQSIKWSEIFFIHLQHLVLTDIGSYKLILEQIDE